VWSVMSAGAWSDQRLYRVSEAMQVLTERDLVISFGGVGLVNARHQLSCSGVP